MSSLRGVVQRLLHRVYLRRTAQHSFGLAGVCRTVGAAMQAGATLQQAFEQAAEHERGVAAEGAHAFAHALAIGMPIERALDQWTARMDDAAADLLADAIRVCHRRGGDLAAVCQRVALVLHERERLYDEGQSLTASARFTARAVIALPVGGFLLWVMLAPASVWSVLGGPAVIAIAPAMIGIVIGVVMIRGLVGRVSSAIRVAPDDSRVTRLIGRLCGEGSLQSQMLRGAGGVLVIMVLLVVASGRVPGGSMMVVFIAMAAAGGWWPVLRRNQRRARYRHVIEVGLPSLLEVSATLLAAGAAPHETVLGAIDRCRGELGELLAPVAAQIRMGRSTERALGASRVVHDDAVLAAWGAALITGARTGAAASAVVDALLADVRSSERERYRRMSAVIGPRIQLAVVIFLVPSITWIVLVATASGMVHQISVMSGV